jgi:alpha-glucuronidase
MPKMDMNYGFGNKPAVPVNVVSKQRSPTLTLAIQELQQGWQGPNGASIVLAIQKDKELTRDGYR